MLKHRVIPMLLLRNGGLVKTVKFKDPKYVGDPINAIRIFNDKEVDELMVLDITASKERREPNYSLIEEFARLRNVWQLPECSSYRTCASSNSSGYPSPR